MTGLEMIAEEIRMAAAELEAENDLAEQRERMRDKYHDEMRETRPWWEILSDDAGMSEKDFL